MSTVFTTPYVEDRADRALRRAIFGFSSALQICPADIEESIINEKLIRKIVENLSSESQEIFFRTLEGHGKDLLAKVKAARESGRETIETDPIAIDDKEALDAFAVFTTEHLLTIDSSPVARYTLEAVLVSIASAFEAFCNQVICVLFMRHPQSIPGKPQIDLELALNAKDLRELILRTCEAQARAQMTGPVEQWLRFIEDRLGTPLPKNLQEWPTSWINVCRIFAMRNCLVHRGGIVDSAFITLMNRYNLPVGKVDDRLLATPTAVRNGIYSACSVVTKTYLQAEYSQAPRNERTQVATRSLSNITQLQWHLVNSGLHNLAKHMDCTSHLRKDEVLMHHVSSWSSRYLNGEEEQVRREIIEREWPDHPEYQLHKAALLGDTNTVRHIADNAINEGMITLFSIRHWPSFNLVRRFLLDMDDSV